MARTGTRWTTETDAARQGEDPIAPGRVTRTSRLPPSPRPPAALPSGTRTVAFEDAPAETVQRSISVGGMADVPAEVFAGIPRGGGVSVPDATRAKMEASFAMDFGSVRIHEGETARAAGAEAFALGEDLHFAPGAFAPGTPRGDQLIGHELAHVAQQRAGRASVAQGKGGIGLNSDPALEAEADAAGVRAARGERVVLPGGGAAAEVVQRKISLGSTSTSAFSVGQIKAQLAAREFPLQAGDDMWLAMWDLDNARFPGGLDELIRMLVHMRGPVAPARTSGPSTSRGGDRDARSTRPEPARKAKRERPGSSDDAPYMGGGPDDEFEFDDEDAARAYWAGAADFDRRRDDYDDGFDDGLDDDYDVGAYFGTEDWQPEPRTTEEDLVAAKEAETFAQSPALMAASATSSWTGYLARLVADLANKRYAQDDGENGDVIAAVLLNHAHLAAFRELQPHLHEDQPRRQVSPLDRDDPLVYYRSQDKNHGQISLYKELMALAGFVNTKDKPMIAPHERALYPLYGLSMTGAPKTARAATTSQKNIATKRSGPPGKTKDLSGPTADYRTKGKHSEIHAAHLGLRKSNATAVPDAVHAAIAANPGGLQKLLAGKIASTGDQGALPLKVLPTTEAHLTAILDRLADLQNRLGALSDPPGADPTPGKAPTSDAEPDASDEILRDELDEAVDPLISTSVELRKLGQASTRGARMIADLPTLTHLRVAGQRGNPQITVEVARPLPVKDLNNKDFETFVDVLRTYFAAQVAVIAAQNGMELGIQLRQSFGFLDSSVTDTGASFRLSWGTEPPEFRHVIGLALQDLDRKLGAEYAKVKGKRDETRALLGVPPSGVKRPMQTMTAAADPRLVAYHKTVAASAGGGLPLADYLAYARSDDGANLPDPHAAPARGPVMRDGLGGDIDAHAGQRAAYLDSLEAASGAALRRIQGSKRTIASPMATASDQFDWELPICEPLANAIVMLSALVTQAMADGAYDPAQWSATRLGAIGQMSLAITQAEAAIEALAALAEVDGSKPTGAQQLLTVRSQVHNRLRNAAEELCEAMFVFMVTTNVHAFERPEDRTEAFLRETLRTDQVQVARTDSGEEASAFALGLLKEEQGSAFHLSFDSRETYFEVEDNVGEGGLAHTDRAPTVTPPTQKPAPKPDPTTYLVDPKPYLTTVDASRAVPAAFLAQVEVVRARVKSMPPPEVASKGVSSPSTATPKPAPPITIMADLTNTDLMNPEILLGILSMERETALGLVRFVLFNSGAKHEQAGLDKMHYGHLTVIGKVLAGMRDLNDSTLLNQFLGLFEDLRAAQSDGDDVGVRVDTWSRQFGTRAPAYDKFMVARGKGDAWLAAQLAFKEASAALDGALDKDQAQGLIADHARTGYKLLDAELDAVATTMALEFADDKVKVDDTVRAAFALLPKADQSEIQNRIVAHETGGRGGDFDDDFDDGFDAQASAATGIENVGNSCYLAAGLNLLAFVDTYYTIFAPKPADTPLIDTPAHVARRALRASVYAVLTGVRAGALVQGAAIRQLRALLDARGLLPPPSAQALAAGQTAMTAQQDPSEAIFRGLLAYFDADTAPMHLQGDEITDFTGAVQTPIVHAHPEQLGEIRPDHLVWRRAARELMLELPMPPGDDLTMQRLIDASLAVQQVPGVYARTAGGPISATVARSVEVTNLPTAVTITIKRAQFGQKDRRDVDAPEVLRIGDRWYRLKAIVHHKGHDMNHGHYTASTRNPLNGEWQYRDDSQVVADDAHFAERKNQGYMYAYELVPDGEDVPDGASARLPTADD